MRDRARADGADRRHQLDAEGRPFAHFALERQRAPERRDDAVADREPEARSDADRLGREERLEDASPHLRRDPDAVVAHLHDHPIGGRRPEQELDLVGLGVVLGESLHRVEQQVQEDLPEPRLVRHHVGDLVVLLDEPRAVANLVGHHGERRVEELRDLQRARASRSRGGRTSAGCGRCCGCAPRLRARDPGRGAPPFARECGRRGSPPLRPGRRPGLPPSPAPSADGCQRSFGSSSETYPRLRRTYASGLLISWATPTASVPSDVRRSVCARRAWISRCSLSTRRRSMVAISVS